MKTPRTPVTLLLALTAVVGFTASARASEVVRVTVPMPFLVHDRLMPAGQYEIQSDSTNPSVLIIEGRHGTRGNAIVSTMPDYGRARSGDQAALTFVRDGNQYRLTKVWESPDEARDLIGR